MVNDIREFFLLLFFLTFLHLCHGSMLSIPSDQAAAHSENADHEKIGRSTKVSTMNTVETSPTVIPNALQRIFQLIFGATAPPNGQDEPTSSYSTTIDTGELAGRTYDPRQPIEDHSDGSERPENGDHSTIATMTAGSHKLTEVTKSLNSTPKKFAAVAARSESKLTEPTVSTKQPNVDSSLTKNSTEKLEQTSGFLKDTGSTNVDDSESGKGTYGPESLSSADQTALMSIATVGKRVSDVRETNDDNHSTARHVAPMTTNATASEGPSSGNHSMKTETAGHIDDSEGSNHTSKMHSPETNLQSSYETERPNPATLRETERPKTKVTKEIERPNETTRQETKGPRTSTVRKSEGANSTKNAEKGGATSTKENEKPRSTGMEITTAASEHKDGSVKFTDQYQLKETTGRTEHRNISKQPASQGHSQAKGSVATPTSSENGGRILTTTKGIENMIHTTTNKSGETARPTDSSERPKSMYHSTFKNAVGTVGLSDPSPEKSRITVTNQAIDLTKPIDGPEKPESIYHSTVKDSLETSGPSGHFEKSRMTKGGRATGASEPAVGSKRSEKVYDSTAMQFTGAIEGLDGTQRPKAPSTKSTDEVTLKVSRPRNSIDSQHAVMTTIKVEYASAPIKPTSTGHATAKSISGVTTSKNTERSIGSEEPEEPTSTGLSVMKYTTDATELTNGSSEPESGDHTTVSSSGTSEHADVPEGPSKGVAHSKTTHITGMNSESVNASSNSTVLPAVETTQDADGSKIPTNNGDSAIMDTSEIARHANTTESTKRIEESEGYVSGSQPATKYTTRAADVTNGIDESENSGPSSTRDLGETTDHTDDSDGLRSSVHSLAKRSAKTRPHKLSKESHSAEAMPTSGETKDADVTETATSNGHTTIMGTSDMAEPANATEMTEPTEDSEESISQNKSSTKDTTNAAEFTEGTEEPGSSGQPSTSEGVSVNTGVSQSLGESAAHSMTEHITAAKSDEPSGYDDLLELLTAEATMETDRPESSNSNGHVGTMSTTDMAGKADSSEKSSINIWSTAENSKGTIEPRNSSEQLEISEQSAAPSSEGTIGVTDLVSSFRGSISNEFSAMKHSTEATDYSYNSSIDSDSATRHNPETTELIGGSEESTASPQPPPVYSTDVNKHADNSDGPSSNDHSAITEPSLVTIFTEVSEKPSANNWSTRNSMETAEATNGTRSPERSEQPITPRPTRENELTGSSESSKNIDISSITTRNTTESIELTDGFKWPDSADGSSEDTRNTTESVNYTESSKAAISGDYQTTAKTSHLIDSTGELRSISYSSSESITKASDGSGGPSITLDSAEYSTGAASHAYGSSDLSDGSDAATMHSIEATKWINGSMTPTSEMYPPVGGSKPQTEYNDQATMQSDMFAGPGSEVPSISTSIADESTHQYSASDSHTTTASDEAGSRRAKTEKYTTDTSHSPAAHETESSRNSSTLRHSTEFVTVTDEYRNTSEGTTQEVGSTTESRIEPGVSGNFSRTTAVKGRLTSLKSSISSEHQPSSSVTTIPDDLAGKYSTPAREHQYVSHGVATDSGSRTENSAGTTDKSSSDGPTYADRSRSTQYTPNFTVTKSRTGSTEYGSRSERPENADDTATKHTAEVTKQSHVSEGLINDSHSTTRPTAGTMSHSFSPTSPQGHPTKRPTDEDSSEGNTVIEKTISTVKNRTAFITFVGGAYLTTDSSIILSTSEKSKSTKRLDNQNSKANATAATHHKDDPEETDAHHPTKHGTHSSKSSVGSYDGYFTKKKKPTETTAERPQDSHESFSTKRSTHSDDSTERSEENHPTKKATVVTTKRQDSSKSDRDDDSGESDKDGNSHESSSKGYSKRRTSTAAQFQSSTRELQKEHSDHSHVGTTSASTANPRSMTHNQNNVQALYSTGKPIHNGSPQSESPTHLPRLPTTKVNYQGEHGESPGKTSKPQVNVESVPTRESPMVKRTTSKTRAHTTTIAKKTTTPVDLMQATNRTSKSPNNGFPSTTQFTHNKLPYSNGSSDPGNITEESVVTQCPQIKFDLSNSLSPLPSSKELSGPQPVGTMVIHMCAVSYVFPSLQQPLKIYECLNTGKWTDNNNGDKCEYVAPRKKNSADL